MGIRQLAAAHNKQILENSATGFGWPITITDPDGTVGALTGFSDDIAQIIDPDTGQAVSGRLASVAINMESLTDSGLGLPKGISNENLKPWVVQFDDEQGSSYTFKVLKSNPDRTLGMVTCLIETYKI